MLALNIKIIMVSKKVILTGSFGVGKTSLFNRFLYSKFEDKYLTTIGVKVDKKVLSIDGSEVTLLLWDIAGEISQNKVPRSYFLGASSIIYVFDLTRPMTIMNLERDLEYLEEITPGIKIKIVGNKKDLVTNEEIEDFCSQMKTPHDILTSAKTGDQVEELFHALGKELLDNVAT